MEYDISKYVVHFAQSVQKRTTQKYYKVNLQHINITKKKKKQIKLQQNTHA